MEITAMTELIEYIESNEIVYNKDLILKLKELLEKEKEQIIDATCLGKYNNIDDRQKGEEYYNQKYNDATK